ncbi:MAG: AMP-binding protein [Halieaceae bacterium]|jgi:crotonobetaine/carnitine-CoA ligase|nr:AMP-binding protein [Halieaceae bacterium]
MQNNHQPGAGRAPTALPVPRLNGCNQRTVPWLLKARAETRTEHPFLIWAPFDRPSQTISYGAFYQAVLSLAAGLRARGVSQGDFVLLHMENCPEFLQTWHACAQLGAVVVTTNTRCTADEVGYFIDHSRPVAAITQPRFADMIRGAGPELAWIAVIDHDAGAAPETEPGDGCLPFSALLADPDGFEPAQTAPEDFNSVQYTSGTTSRPKGVVWTHANAVFAARSNAQVCTVTADDVGHTYLPLCHTNALSYSHLATLWAGATLVIQPRFSASRFWDCVVQHRCTWGIQIPFGLKALMGQPVPEGHALTRWGLGAHDPEIVRSLTGIPCIGWFGMTETVALPIYSVLGLPGREMSMGQPSPEYEVQVRGADGAEAAWGESGRLWIRGIPGLSLFHSYLHNPDATANAFDDQGWFDTGDMVTATEDGFITYDGRSGDMLRVGAENVAESEIERVVGAVPGVLEVAVVGRPDPMLDEVPVAFVEAPGVVTEEARTELAGKIIDHCRNMLADFKVPRDVTVLDHIPRVTLGKLDKKTLRAQLAAAQED